MCEFIRRHRMWILQRSHAFLSRSGRVHSLQSGFTAPHSGHVTTFAPRRALYLIWESHLMQVVS